MIQVNKLSDYVSELHKGRYYIGCSANGAILYYFGELQDVFEFLFHYKELFEVFEMKTDYEITQSKEYKEYCNRLKIN